MSSEGTPYRTAEWSTDYRNELEERFWKASVFDLS